ncbi:MAG: hypothetical protein AAB913_02015 [Patescibacteria group bacterium]
MKITKIISFIFILFLLNSNIVHLYAGSNSIQIDLGVNGCNNNGICEPSTGETSLSCPVDCAVVTPPPSPSRGGGGGIIAQENIYLYNLSIQPNFINAIINWNSSVSTISAIKWGETTEVKEGTLSSIVFARDHKIEIINLKPGTMYYFTIESRDASGKSNTYPPTYFFTKFLKDTTFPLNPRNVKASTDILSITITWKNPPDPNFSYVRIMRHEDRFRGDPFLGKLIYEGSAEKFLNKNVIAGKKYFYVLFSKDNKGNYSSGVAVSETAYSTKKIPTQPETPIETPIKIIPTQPEKKPLEIPVTETFFAHQYNQQVEPLANTKAVIIGNDKSTVIDINSKTFPDDLVKVINKDGELIGQYLFSFNKDSGRYQSVIPPLEKEGNYNVKIYRYKDNVPTIISEGLLNIKENIVPKIEKYNNNNYIINYVLDHLQLIYIIISIIILIITAFLLKPRTKNPIK